MYLSWYIFHTTDLFTQERCKVVSRSNFLLHFSSGVTLTLWSNPLNPELCPVTALCFWLFLAGLINLLVMY